MRATQQHRPLHLRDWVRCLTNRRLEPRRTARIHVRSPLTGVAPTGSSGASVAASLVASSTATGSGASSSVRSAPGYAAISSASATDSSSTPARSAHPPSQRRLARLLPRRPSAQQPEASRSLRARRPAHLRGTDSGTRSMTNGSMLTATNVPLHVLHRRLWGVRYRRRCDAWPGRLEHPSSRRVTLTLPRKVQRHPGLDRTQPQSHRDDNDGDHGGSERALLFHPPATRPLRGRDPPVVRLPQPARQHAFAHDGAIAFLGCSRVCLIWNKEGLASPTSEEGVHRGGPGFSRSPASES
jgi:hypothetical protein